MTNHFAGT